MHEDRTCVGIFNLQQGTTVPAQGPPVKKENAPIRRMIHFVVIPANDTIYIGSMF